MGLLYRYSAPDLACAVGVLDVFPVALRGERRAVVGVGDGADHVEVGKLHVLDVRRGDLQRIEKKTRALGVDLIGGEGLRDLHESELNGELIFKRRKIERRVHCRSLVSLRMTFRRGADGIRAVVDGLSSAIDGGAAGRCRESDEAAVRAALAVANGLALIEASVEVAPIAVFQ